VRMKAETVMKLYVVQGEVNWEKSEQDKVDGMYQEADSTATPGIRAYCSVNTDALSK